jgi:4-hydroxy-tetrahydrodipicolinate synthase
LERLFSRSQIFYGDDIFEKDLIHRLRNSLGHPLRGGEVDLAALGRLMNIQSRGGCSAAVVCGTTGESAVLSQAEHKSIVRFAVSHANGEYPVIAGTGSNDTQKALALSCQAEDCGADGVLIVTPYYNKTTQKGLIAHYTYIADRISIPVIVYNVPSRTGMTKSGNLRRAVAASQYSGVKEAGTDLDAIIKAMTLCSDDFDFYSGNDNLALPLFALGAKGLISVASNIIPEVMSAICALCLAGRYDAARALNMEYFRCSEPCFARSTPYPSKRRLTCSAYALRKHGCLSRQ